MLEPQIPHRINQCSEITSSECFPNHLIILPEDQVTDTPVRTGTTQPARLR